MRGLPRSVSYTRETLMMNVIAHFTVKAPGLIPNPEANHGRDRVVLRWGTAREVRLVITFLLFCCSREGLFLYSGWREVVPGVSSVLPWGRRLLDVCPGSLQTGCTDGGLVRLLAPIRFRQVWAGRGEAPAPAPRSEVYHPKSCRGARRRRRSGAATRRGGEVCRAPPSTSARLRRCCACFGALQGWSRSRNSTSCGQGAGAGGGRSANGAGKVGRKRAAPHPCGVMTGATPRTLSRYL